MKEVRRKEREREKERKGAVIKKYFDSVRTGSGSQGKSTVSEIDLFFAKSLAEVDFNDIE